MSLREVRTRSIHQTTTAPATSSTSWNQKPHTSTTCRKRRRPEAKLAAAITGRRKTPVQGPPRTEAPTRSSDPPPTNPTGPPPPPEQETARWRRAWKTLFHRSRAASTLQAPPGHQTLHLKGPNLHSRAKNHPFPSHPRPTRPPEARKNGGLTGWSTRSSRRLRSRREKRRGFERKVAGPSVGVARTQHPQPEVRGPHQVLREKMVACAAGAGGHRCTVRILMRTSWFPRGIAHTTPWPSLQCNEAGTWFDWPGRQLRPWHDIVFGRVG